MKFDAIIFRGEIPFRDMQKPYVRLFGLSLEEVKMIYNIVKRGKGHGVFFYYTGEE